MQIEPVPELTGNKRSYLFAIFRRFGPGRSVFSVDSAESGSVTAFTHNHWQMVFNVKKCKVLHISHNNAFHSYRMNGEELQSVSEETDLGIIVSNDLKSSKQCVSAVKKANMTLGMIKRHIVSRDKKTIVTLSDYTRALLGRN